MRKIAIIGGGAAGMMAAITAAGAGGTVTVYEHKDRVGKKLLSTGNGKCNLTNLSVSQDDYRGDHPAFVLPVLDAFPVADTLSFFEQLGLFWKEKNGYVYPASNQASTVLDLLRNRMEQMHICVITDCGQIRLRAIRGKKQEGFLIACQKGEAQYDRVIIATGSKAAPVTGSDGSGYALAKQFGHRIIPVLPALTSLKGREDFYKSIAGVRVDADIALYIEDRLCMREMGELQLTATGPSGIPVFQLSRFAIQALDQHKNVRLCCDFLPRITEDELTASVLARRESNLTAGQALTGIVNKKLLVLLLKLSQIAEAKPMRAVSEQKLQLFCHKVKCFEMQIGGYGSFEQAQVCQGGVDVAELTDDLESRQQKGLYFAGEILDVDGICGGYNLQWAWSSGHMAGKAAAEK
ncbi:MAG: aminoacetone oxidase family FAD-binding enzyme [Lachnospiraceae bacterium]|nr:aminoacetone oxidase family FAD-binding enzyme [Lachnospiraceae bacterium]